MLRLPELLPRLFTYCLLFTIAISPMVFATPRYLAYGVGYIVYHGSYPMGMSYISFDQYYVYDYDHDGEREVFVFLKNQVSYGTGIRGGLLVLNSSGVEVFRPFTGFVPFNIVCLGNRIVVVGYVYREGSLFDIVAIKAYLLDQRFREIMSTSYNISARALSLISPPPLTILGPNKLLFTVYNINNGTELYLLTIYSGNMVLERVYRVDNYIVDTRPIVLGDTIVWGPLVLSRNFSLIDDLRNGDYIALETIPYGDEVVVITKGMDGDLVRIYATYYNVVNRHVVGRKVVINFNRSINDKEVDIGYNTYIGRYYVFTLNYMSNRTHIFNIYWVEVYSYDIESGNASRLHRIEHGKYYYGRYLDLFITLLSKWGGSGCRLYSIYPGYGVIGDFELPNDISPSGVGLGNLVVIDKAGSIILYVLGYSEFYIVDLGGLIPLDQSPLIHLVLIVAMIMFLLRRRVSIKKILCRGKL